MTIKLKDLIKEDVINEVNLNSLVSPFLENTIKLTFKMLTGHKEKVRTSTGRYSSAMAWGGLTTYSKSDFEVKLEITAMMGGPTRNPHSILFIVDLDNPMYKGRIKEEFEFSQKDDDKAIADKLARWIQQRLG